MPFIGRFDNPSREKRIEIRGSPPFRNSPGSDLSASGGRFRYAPQVDEEEGKYLPFDYLKVSNDSNENLEVVFNGDGRRVEEVEQNTTEIFRPTDILPYNSVTLVNNSGNIVAKEDVTITSRRIGATADKQARREAGKGPIAQVVENFTGLNVSLGV